MDWTIVRHSAIAHMYPLCFDEHGEKTLIMPIPREEAIIGRLRFLIRDEVEVRIEIFPRLQELQSAFVNRGNPKLSMCLCCQAVVRIVPSRIEPLEYVVLCILIFAKLIIITYRNLVRKMVTYIYVCMYVYKYVYVCIYLYIYIYNLV